MSQLGHGSYEDWSLGSNMPGSMEPETRDHLVLIQISMKTARKYAYIATVVLFEADSALCGDAPNMNAVGRVITVAVNLVSGHLGLS
ncbi:hypothetical protein PENSOL_c016G10561 [Penicillium solitum]|uniref:Uncharacterized protein n=1 Tax=Penicillium solitum TaxID=60172 RepID=A0A1V6R5G7_9EURO|nr:uncharacterized protein PENSOL_c016G10561 [Penicillium solitum]OQD96462.1 hypothetical protein PENSOL_c016G10561 [Penicillium solitum]